MNKLEQFFYDHAGPSPYSLNETPEDAHRQRAWCLATAYVEAIAGGYAFLWEEDDEDPSQLQCTMLNAQDEPAQALYGIDVPRLSAPYCRVVEAELALQELG